MILMSSHWKVTLKCKYILQLLEVSKLYPLSFIFTFYPFDYYMYKVQETNNITPDSNIKVTRLIKPLHPNIIMYILHTVLHTFSRS